MWVSQYLDFYKSCGNDDHKIDGIDQSISTLGEKYADWQLNQANGAIRAYFLFQARETTPQDPATDSTDTHWKQVAEEMVRMLRLKQRSRGAEPIPAISCITEG